MFNRSEYILKIIRLKEIHGFYEYDHSLEYYEYFSGIFEVSIDLNFSYIRTVQVENSFYEELLKENIFYDVDAGKVHFMFLDDAIQFKLKYPELLGEYTYNGAIRGLE